MQRILVVDDDRHVRETIARTLADHSYDVESAEEGGAASRLHRRKPADLLVTDIIMPRQEGLETIMELRRDFPDLKIIAISGGGRGKAADYLEIAGRMGADMTIEKPIDPDALLRAIEGMIGAPGN